MEQTPSIGYLIKQAQSLLHARIEEALRPHGLTVSQYSCLFRLHAEPGTSAADLARATFVTRQSMNAMLQNLIDRGLVARPTVASTGRALPVTLTTAGGRALTDARAEVDGVELRMLAALAPADTDALSRGLQSCAEELGQRSSRVASS